MGTGEAEARGLDLPAVTGGWLWAMGTLAAAALVLALAVWRLPLYPRTLAMLALLAQVVAALAGGLRSGRRATGSGLLHGLVTGLALLLTVAAAESIAAKAPGLPDLLRRGAILAGTGALGGVVGANLRQAR